MFALVGGEFWAWGDGFGEDGLGKEGWEVCVVDGTVAAYIHTNCDRRTAYQSIHTNPLIPIT